MSKNFNSSLYNGIVSLSLLYSIHFNLVLSSNLSSIAAVRYTSKVSCPNVFSALFFVAGGREVGITLVHCRCSKELLLEFFERALDVICVVDRTFPADIVWLPCSFQMSASVPTLHDEQDHPLMRP